MSPYSGPAVRLCQACRVHVGFWPESDPRCPSCRNSGRVPEGGAR